MIRLGALLFLSGCATAPDVRVWLKPCPVEEPQTYSVAEATRVANARRAALLQCNADKAAIAKALRQ